MVRRSPRPVGSLPAEVTSLVGRRAETDDLRRLLGRSRLITLTGPGGAGKTRLALHVARSARSAFEGGVWMAPLAELTQPDLIPDTVLSVLGASGAATKAGSAGISPAARIRALVDVIGDTRMMLLLDNCEHLAAAAADLAAELLRACPQLTILATSREALRVLGEAVYRVPALSLPVPGEGPMDGGARRYDGVALFLERAAALNDAFREQDVDEDAVVTLCRRLDGLPLAIELAASGTRWMSLETLLEIAERPFAQGLSPLTQRGPARQQSLRASLDYSHDLCSPAARRLWARMTVFRGGADLAAVRSICADAGPQAQLPAQKVAPALFELVDKSIVTFDGARYQMLETIRQYGEELLSRYGDDQQLHAAHLHHFATLVNLPERWFGPEQQELLDKVRLEQPNIRAALEHSLSPGGDVGAGLAMASSMWTFWIGGGRPVEGRLWFGRLLEAVQFPTADRVLALWVNGFLTAVDGDIPSARQILAECLAAAEEIGDDAGKAHAVNVLGFADLFQGHVDEAVQHLEEGVRLERLAAVGGPFLIDALSNLGLAYCYGARMDDAVRVLEEARRLSAEQGEELLLSWSEGFLGYARLLSGQVEEAFGLMRRSLARKRSMNNRQGMTWGVELVGWATYEAGETARAAMLLTAAAARAQEYGPIFNGFDLMFHRHEQYLDGARRLLGLAEFRSAVERGRAMSLDEAVASALGERTGSSNVEQAPARNLLLTPREHEIALLVADGRTNREIAAVLVIAPRTVDTHVQNILTKLDFSSRNQVVAMLARQQG